MKLARLVDEKLHNTLDKLTREPLPLKTAFKLKGIVKMAREEFSKYEEVRKEALQHHGKKNEDGSLVVNEAGNVQFTEEGIKAFVIQLNELTSMDVVVPTISIAELGNNITLTVDELEILDGLIVE